MQSTPISPLPPAIFLMGPTAAGKTDLAVALVQQLPCEIISVDSVMVYRGMDIGAAKPGPEVLRVAPHRLIDLRDPAEAYSAAQFCADALDAMRDITAAGRIPLLVGGTMLYFHALRHGLSALPSADAALRARLEAWAARDGWAVLHAHLARVDPDAARRIHAHDPQRIQRALEVYELTGVPLSRLQRRHEGGTPLPYQVIPLVIAPRDRAALHQRIALRFEAMLAQGLVAEVEGLYRRGDLHGGLPALRAVGYRQVWEYLSGELDYAHLAERAIIATRQFAKRQLTWLRAVPDAHWLTSDTDIIDQALKAMAHARISD